MLKSTLNFANPLNLYTYLGKGSTVVSRWVLFCILASLKSNNKIHVDK
jgi:hypothetical protein